MSKYAKKTEAQQVEALEAVKAKVARAQEQLEQQLAALQTGDDWRKALEAMAVLGPTSISRFSFGNVVLLMAQRGPVGHAATYKTWQRLGRNVKKGEHGAMILRPRIVRRKGEDANGKPEEKKKLAGFSYLTVFSLDQTDGPELPKMLPPSDISTPAGFPHTVEALTRLVRHVEGVNGITLRPRETGDHRTAEGWFHKPSKQIVVITGEKSEAQTLSTLLHEVAHAVLHGDEHHATPTAEVEAESTAYVVSHALGLDTAAYSLPYVATWANRSDEKNPTKAVARVGERIRKAANIILEALCPALADDVDEEAAQRERAA